MFFKLNGKKVLITGSTGTIGSSIVKIFDQSGAILICTSTSSEKLKNLKKLIGNKHFFYLVDLNNKENLENRLDEIVNTHDDISILINNAGINLDNLSLRMTNEKWEEVINVNLTSNFKIIKKITPLMIKLRFGRIIGISSIIGFTGNKGQSNYSASKSGMIGLYKSLALEYASRGITVNLIAPGFIKSNMTNKLNQIQIQNILTKIPLNKLGSSDDIAYGVLFLASEESSYITGNTIHINGGMLMV